MFGSFIVKSWVFFKVYLHVYKECGYAYNFLQLMILIIFVLTIHEVSKSTERSFLKGEKKVCIFSMTFRFVADVLEYLYYNKTFFF